MIGRNSNSRESGLSGLKVIEHNSNSEEYGSSGFKGIEHNSSSEERIVRVIQSKFSLSRIEVTRERLNQIQLNLINETIEK